MDAMDARAELKRRLDAGEVSPEDAERALASLTTDDDVVALRAAERWGTLTREESRAMIDDLDVSDEALQDVARRYGVRLSAA